MTNLHKNLKFKFTWRSYQEQFLGRFNDHLKDDHLHIVAPPGSGKTILGLEMLVRINKPTLILAPTLTIRNQWISRLETFFRINENFNNYTVNIKKPKLLTFSTYQSLHALDKSLVNEKKALVDFIKEHHIQTLVLDEAHHLKNAWWKSLFALKKIKGLTIISLTATPPYDSSTLELNKYFDLCGPLDDEIAVPDLIKNGDLCPHQDFIYFSKPDAAQIKYIVDYREQIINFNNALVANEEFQKVLLHLPLYAQSEKELEAIYEMPEFFSSILIFLNASGHPIEKKKLKFLGFTEQHIVFPNLNYEWLEILLQQMLVDQREQLEQHEVLLQQIEKKLKQIGVFDKKRVNFIGDAHLYRTLANSPSKLKSIAAIIAQEKKNIGEDLRAVVLTDFIRKEYLDFKGDDTSALNKLGVVSIFQYIRVALPEIKEIAVLTGSLVIVHREVLKNFSEQVNGATFRVSECTSRPDYAIIESSDTNKNTVVACITSLFEKGFVKVLVGTKSLLGEGWDAPSINTLILASYIGSFVSSNQMRGRAIRVDVERPHKTGNIWHLACIDPTAEDGGKDLEKLENRFEAFSGVSLLNTTYIENGLERLQLPKRFNAETDLDVLNIEMFKMAAQRDQLKARWDDAISKGSVLIREVKVPYLNETPFKKAKKLRWGNASKYLLIEIVIGAGLLFPEFLVKHIGTLVTKGIFQFIYIFLLVIGVGLAPKTFKAVKLYFLFGNTHKKTKRIGLAIRQMMFQTKLIQTSLEKVEVITEQQGNGAFVCFLKGATNAESILFVNLLAEVLAPVENPRYLLVYRHWIKRHWGLRNYYVVPAQFGKRKDEAERFHKCWKKHVDGSKLLYTRSLAGRKELLKARLSHIVYQFREVSKKAITWK